MPMQPAITGHKELNIDFYVSPHKIIRYACNQGHDYTYSGNFKVHGLTTFTQIAGPSPNEFSLKMKVEFHCEITKSVMMITGLIYSECEKACKKSYQDSCVPHLHKCVQET